MFGAAMCIEVAFALDGPILLTQNLTEVESRMESKFAGTGFRQKNHREQSSLPLPSCNAVVSCDSTWQRFSLTFIVVQRACFYNIHSTSFYTILHHSTSFYIILHHSTSFYIILHRSTSFYIILHHSTSTESTESTLCVHFCLEDILVAALDVSLERSDAVSKMDRNRLLHKFLEEAGVEVAAVPLNRQFAPRHTLIFFSLRSPR